MINAVEKFIETVRIAEHINAAGGPGQIAFIKATVETCSALAAEIIALREARDGFDLRDKWPEVGDRIRLEAYAYRKLYRFTVHAVNAKGGITAHDGTSFPPMVVRRWWKERGHE